MSKKSRILTMVMMMTFVLVLAGISQLQAAEKVTCPVTGEEFEKTEDTASFEYKDKTYYFCCPDCKDTFVKNPTEFLKEEGGGEHQHGEVGEGMHEHGDQEMHGEHQESATAIDPVCGMEVKIEGAKHTYELEGKTYYFCMAGCKDKFAENPEAYLNAIDPVCGMKVKKEGDKHTYEYIENTYYFCMAGCKDKFEADPEKFLKKI